jgi:hypothetical protein
MSLVKELGERVPTAEAVTEALSGPRKRFPADRLVREAVLTNPFYFQGRGHQRRHALRSLEEDQRHAEQVDFDVAELSIEHILPQKPSPAWMKQLEAEGEGEETPEEVHASVVHTLGNLTLTAYNQVLSKRRFRGQAGTSGRQRPRDQP